MDFNFLTKEHKQNVSEYTQNDPVRILKTSQSTIKRTPKSKSKSAYKPMTEAQKQQARDDRAYHRNWEQSIRMMRAKSQRLADLNNRYYNA